MVSTLVSDINELLKLKLNRLYNNLNQSEQSELSEQSANSEPATSEPATSETNLEKFKKANSNIIKTEYLKHNEEQT
jgi:hypothetical protein